MWWQVNEYEQQRLDNIARNRQRMLELDLVGAVASVSPLPLPCSCPCARVLRSLGRLGACFLFMRVNQQGPRLTCIASKGGGVCVQVVPSKPAKAISTKGLQGRKKSKVRDHLVCGSLGFTPVHLHSHHCFNK